MVNNTETCFAEIYLEVARQTPGKLPGGLSIKATETVGWGTDYTLERFSENGWEMLKIPAALETKESSQAVAGETKEGTLDLAADGIRLEAGQYRLKKNAGFLTTKTTARRS
ncbi:MAG: immunoglobulin-like domain-containing protein [Gallintestinimicrobium sp.]